MGVTAGRLPSDAPAVVLRAALSGAFPEIEALARRIVTRALTGRSTRAAAEYLGVSKRTLERFRDDFGIRERRAMSKTTTEKIETVTRYYDRYACDFCGADLAERMYEISRVRLSCETGTSYPEGGSKATTTIDCCVACWTSRVLPALEALGATPRVEESDW